MATEFSINSRKISAADAQGAPLPFPTRKRVVGKHFPTTIIHFSGLQVFVKCSDGRRWLPFVKQNPQYIPTIHLYRLCASCVLLGLLWASRAPPGHAMRPQTRSGFMWPPVGSQGRFVCLLWGAWACWGSRPLPRPTSHGRIGPTGRPMKRATPRRGLENRPRNDARFQPQFFTSGFFTTKFRVVHVWVLWLKTLHRPNGE